MIFVIFLSFPQPFAFFKEYIITKLSFGAHTGCKVSGLPFGFLPTPTGALQLEPPQSGEFFSHSCFTVLVEGRLQLRTGTADGGTKRS